MATAASLAACSAGPAPDGDEVDAGGELAGKQVVYIDALPGNDLLDGIAQGLNASLSDQGATLARTFQLNAQNQLDLSVANQRINEAIAMGADAIVVFPLDANAIRPGVAAANEAGVPIFTIQDIGDLDVTGKVALPDEARGQATAEVLGELLGGSGQVTIISNNPTDNVEAAVRGARAGIEASGLTLVGDPDNQRNLEETASEAERLAQGILAQYPELTGLIVNSAESATGAISAVQKAGRADQVKVATMAGSDINIEQVTKGELAASYDLCGTEYGTAMAELVVRALLGESLDNEVVQAPEGVVYTSENVAEFVPWSERLDYVDIPSTF